MIVLELKKDNEVFGYADYFEIVNKLKNSELVRYSRLQPMSNRSLMWDSIETEHIVITQDDILFKKYREIDISKDTLNFKRELLRVVIDSPFRDRELLDKLHSEVTEIELIRYRLGIHS